MVAASKGRRLTGNVKCLASPVLKVCGPNFFPFLFKTTARPELLETIARDVAIPSPVLLLDTRRVQTQVFRATAAVLFQLGEEKKSEKNTISALFVCRLPVDAFGRRAAKRVRGRRRSPCINIPPIMTGMSLQHLKMTCVG